MNKIITKKHQIFGEIRFSEGKPYLHDIAKSLNYRDDSYFDLVKNNIVLSKDNMYLVDDIGIDILICNSNTKVPIIFRQWIDYILPYVRKSNKIEILPSMPIKQRNIHNEAFLNYLNTIPEESWITIPVHGFSNNYMYEHGENGDVKTDKYTKWRNKFPTQNLNKLSYIDFSKPVQAIYKFDQLERFDTPNMGKSIADTIADYFNVDDHQIINQICIKGEVVNSFREGKIHIYMYNI